jgi:hypothetical protein
MKKPSLPNRGPVQVRAWIGALRTAVEFVFWLIHELHKQF